MADMSLTEGDGLPGEPRSDYPQSLSAAAEHLIRRTQNYQRPLWVAEGDLWTPDQGGINRFHPDRYDPAAPHIPKGEVYTLESNPGQILENPFDLRNLRILDGERVIKFHHDLEELIKRPENRNKLVVGMLNTGGTVMMQPDERGELTPGLTAEQLLAGVGQNLEQRFALATIDLPTPIDSSQMEIDYDADLAIALSYVWKHASVDLRHRLGGFLLAHGTDTLGPSGMYTTMMLGPLMPFRLGFFGAQKSTDEKHTDAFINTKLALEILEKFHEEQTMVSFVAMGGSSGGAYLTVGTNKTSDRLVLAMESPAHPKLLDVNDFGVEGVNHPFNDSYNPLRSKDVYRVYQSTGEEFWPMVLRGYRPVISLRPDEGDNPEDMYNAVKNSRAPFVFVTTFGSYTINDKPRKAIIEAARETGKIVIAANPFPEGSLDHHYKAAAEVRRSGIIGTQVLPAPAAAKLFLGSRIYGNGNPDEVIRFLNDTNYTGEQAPRLWSQRLKVESGLTEGVGSAIPKIKERGVISQPQP